MSDKSTAFGAPGIEPRWTSSAKDGVGTAYHSASRVWFTLSHGIINEIYYPHVDTPNTRDLQFLITDGETFCHEEKRDLLHQTEYPEQNALLYRLTNSDPEGRYLWVRQSALAAPSQQRQEIQAGQCSDNPEVVAQSRTFQKTTMKSAFPHLARRGFTRVALGVLLGLFAAPGPLCAQTLDEHASHHPAAAGAGAMPAAGGSPTPAGGMPAAGGGMMEQMGEMMKGMGKPPPKELYPSLMAMPELTPEKRQQVEQQAAERMHAGTMLMGQALDTLNAGTQSGDYTAMHEAMTRLREGAAQLESGIAARRALAEGRAPREVALAWFRREMSLVSPTVDADAHSGRGLSALHLFTMALLIAFAFAMLAMYFFKMRRATALFGRIEPDKGPPPPGSAPELAAGKPPPGDKPSAKEKPPSRRKPPAEDKPPSIDKPAAPEDEPAALADKPAAPAETPATDAPPKAP